MTLTLNLSAVWPVLAPALGALLVLVLDVGLPRSRRVHQVHLGLAAAALLGGGAATLPGLPQPRGDRLGAFCTPSGDCLYAAGSVTSGLQLLALGSALVVLVLTWGSWATAPANGRPAVQVFLLLAATAGVVAVPAARDLGSLLVALELATLPAVALVALESRAARVPRAVDGAVALLTTSLVSLALLALGAALWVAATGTGMLSPAAARAAAQAGPNGPLLVLAAVLAVSGIAFKLSAVPFHAWTPLTYSAAPLPVTVYLAGVSKVAALAALVVLVEALSGAAGFTLLVLGLLAALSMTVGNVMALRQVDLVHLLAWSAVAQAGWLLLPLSAVSARAVQAAAGYLAVYVVATVLAFAVVIAVAGAPGRGIRLEHHRGLARDHPLTAAALAMALLALAGLPPAVVGLVAKVVVLRPVAGEGTWWLAVVAALNVALGIAVYLRWIATLVQRPEHVRGEGMQAGTDPRGRTAYRLSWPHRVVISVLASLLVLGSIAPVGIW